MKKINKVLYQTGRKYESKRYPMIRIANNHLLEAGFKYGNSIEINYKKDIIIIKKY